MNNYRGGERAMSGYGADAVKAITEGRTNEQQTRNLREKVLMGGIQAALTAAGAGASASHSFALQRKQANKAWDINNAGIQAREKLADEQSRAMGDGRAREAGKVPAWLGQGGPVDVVSGGNAPHQPDMISGAQTAMSNQQQNDAADNAPLGGYYTSDGSQAAQDQANALTNDMKTAEDGMRGGGMMGSLQRKGMY